MGPRRRLRERDLRRFEHAFKETLENLGHIIDIYVDNPNKEYCPTCGWDPSNEESTDPNCTTCGGIGKVNLYIVYTIHNVAVRWFDGSVVWDRSSAGRYEIGDARLFLYLSDVLIDPTDYMSRTYFHDAIKVDVDGIECEVKGPPTRKGIGRMRYCSVLVSRIEQT